MVRLNIVYVSDSYRLFFLWMEELNPGPSVRIHLEADVRGIRRSLQMRSDGTEGRFVFCAPLLSFFFCVLLMSDSESLFESEPNVFDGESSDDLFSSNSEAVSLDVEGGEDTDVKILSEGSSSVPTHDIGKGLMTKQPMLLAVVYCDGSHVGMGQHCNFQIGDARMQEVHTGQQSEASTSGRLEPSAEPSTLPRVDYLEPNKITEREIAKYRAEYCIMDSVRMRIPGPTESLRKPKDGEVVFFTD
ncbi:unnamed protein product, partial [Prunus brigantina]